MGVSISGRKAPTKNSAKRKAGIKSISSEKRLETMLKETEAELAMLQPRIEKLEKAQQELMTLRQTKQKLITLKLSLQSILENYTEDSLETPLQPFVFSPTLSTRPPHMLEASGTFFPNQAFEEAKHLLRRKNSLNYELFRAIVLKGGQATTEEIKDYLVKGNITQPNSGIGFESVPLTDISSRVNYLVRKGVVQSDGHGTFMVTVGWQAQ